MIAFSYVYEPERRIGGPALQQWCFAAAGGASDGVTGRTEGGGDTANSSQSLCTRTWNSALVQYRFTSSAVAPLFTPSFGANTTQKTQAPGHELGISAGIRF